MKEIAFAKGQFLEVAGFGLVIEEGFDDLVVLESAGKEKVMKRTVAARIIPSSAAESL
jgi:hypothetical protein